MRVVRYDEHGPSKQARAAFDSGEPSLNRWLATKARQSMESRNAVTHLLVDDAVIAGYFCLAAGQVAKQDAPTELARAAPDPVPAVRMGRFAIDRRYQGQGWGTELLADALLRAVSAAQLIGARVLLVDAINEDAKRFYLRFGFTSSPIHPLQVMHDLRVVAASAGVDAGQH